MFLPFFEISLASIIDIVIRDNGLYILTCIPPTFFITIIITIIIIPFNINCNAIHYKL